MTPAMMPAREALPVRLMCPFILTAALLLGGCGTTEANLPEPISFDAVVQLLVLNDGPPAYILDDTETDAAYYPLNLPREFQEEGIRVHVEGLLIHEYRVLLHPPVEISLIVQIDD